MPSLGVLESTLPVVESARHVQVDRERLTELCRDWLAHPLEIPGWDAEIHWSDGGPAALNYVLLLDALNFCFWSSGDAPRWGVYVGNTYYDGYKALAAALKRAVESGIPVTSADYLANLTSQQLDSILSGTAPVPMLEYRLANAREVGQVLLDKFQGQFSQAVEQAGGSAPSLAEILAQNFSSFRDEASYGGRPVRLLKRAQITVVDVYGTFGGQGYGRFDDIAELTAFADYKIPQVLRAQGILIYSSELAAKVDSKTELPAGSPEEIEIRAAMIWAVEWLRQGLKALGRPIQAYELDWLLWNIGQRPVAHERPYHRTRTIFY